MSTPTHHLRKQARQTRAHRTVQAILDAAAHILRTRGTLGFTTNHLAEEAGVSVGSIYQYFPNKEAILKELMRGHYESAMRTRPAVLDSGGDITLRERLTATVGWHLLVCRHDIGLIQRLLEIQAEVLGDDGMRWFGENHRAAVQLGLSHHKLEITHDDLTGASIVVSEILRATTLTAPAARPALLDDADYEACVVRMLFDYLVAS